MDYNELLERYFEGTATLEEERILRRWADAPDYARAMFGVFEEAAAHRSSCELDLVAAHPNKHKYQLKNQLSVSKMRRRRFWTIPAVAAAAAVVLLVALDNRPPVLAWVNGEPVRDYDTAYAYTSDALSKLDSSLSYLELLK